MFRLWWALGVLSAMLGPAAWADGAALIVSESAYRTLDRAPDPAPALEPLLAEAGFEVTTARDLEGPALWDVLRTFRSRADGAERVLIVLSGHMARTGGQDWLFTVSAEAPDAFSAGAAGVPLAPMLEIAARHPGQGIVLLGQAGVPRGAGLAPVAPEAPQGVTVITGPPEGLEGALGAGLLVPGKSLSAALAGLPRGFRAEGFVSPAAAFLPAPEGVPRPPSPDRELAFWEVVSEINTTDAYRAYLRRFPNGKYAGFAKEAISAIEADAERQAQAAEAALGLDREARKKVQRDLALLGHDPKGIDGVFGPGTRAAIADWQRAQGHPPTGYLTAAQLAELSARAKARAAELEAQAKRKQAEAERQDRAYWKATGEGADEAGLRAYLSRYPDGLFAELARERLAAIEAERRDSAAAQERALWDETLREDTEGAYRDYLARYPRGPHAAEAQARLEALTQGTADAEAVARAKAEEEKIIVNRAAALLVEQRLSDLGYQLTVDGAFDDETRRAVRRFQRDQGLPATGYVDQATMLRLVASG